MYVRFV